MRNIKFVSIFAACGFVLSFVFGLFSHSSFISILLKALIFGAVFVGLGFLVSFLFDKFLSDSDTIDFGTDDNSENATVSTSAASPASTGQLIDVVVEDEALTPSESDNHFVVGDNHQMLKKTDIKDENIDSGFEGNNSREFVPLRTSENASNFSGVESVNPNEVSSSSSEDSQMEDDIDTLPDMESLSFSDESDTDDNESYGDSGFVSSANTYKKSDGSTPDVKDASLIAKAISSALAEEDSL